VSRGELDTTELTESSKGPQETGEPTSLQDRGNTTWFYNSRNGRKNSITTTSLSTAYLFAEEQPTQAPGETISSLVQHKESLKTPSSHRYF